MVPSQGIIFIKSIRVNCARTIAKLIIFFGRAFQSTSLHSSRSSEESSLSSLIAPADK